MSNEYITVINPSMGNAKTITPDCVMKYRKKPLVIEAIQWNGKNTEAATKFIIDGGGDCFLARTIDTPIYIKTLEGTIEANRNDWIIKGVNGEFYPIKDEIFKKTYEAV